MPQPKGKSGNPKGRPKGVKNKASIAIKERLLDVFNGEINDIPKNLKKLQPIQRLEILAKFLPFFAPKLQNIAVEPENQKEKMQPPDFTFIVEDMSDGNEETPPETT